MGLFGFFKKDTRDSLKQFEPPRKHHYDFAYKALPGLAFSDPHVPLGFGNNSPKGCLAKFWACVGEKLPEDERLSDSGLLGTGTPFGPHYAIVLIDMPKPLREAEAYFVAIVYPKSWFNDSNAYKNSQPELRYFILEKCSMAGIGGGTLRALNRKGHGAIKYGIPVSAESFLKEIQNVLLNPPPFIVWVDSKPWNIMMQDPEKGEASGSI